MSNSQIVAAILAAIVGGTVFLLKFMFARLAENVKESFSSLVLELKEINKKVDILSQHYAASSVREERNEQEINTLRMRQHEMANEQAKIQAIIEKCKNCTKQ